MALDREDVDAIRGLIEDAERRAFAGALRFMAGGLRAEADLLTGRAIVAEEYAGAVERGEAEMPRAPLRLGVIAETAAAAAAPAAEPEDDGEPDTLQRITIPEGGQRMHVADEEGGPSGEDFSPEMAEWLDRFDDRIRASKHFVTAVNEAADASRRLDEQTARMVADRVAELTFSKPAPAEGPA